MRILSFDTSSETLQLSLFEDGSTIFERSGCEADASAPKGAERQQVATMLVPLIDDSMRAAGWTKESLDCIVVGQGPGSFTGIRSGVVTARTLAQALNLPLIAVCLLETLASACPLPVAVLLPGGKGHYFVGAYEDGADGSPDSTGPMTEPSTLLKTLVAPSYVPSTEINALLGAVPRWSVDPLSAPMPDAGAGHDLIELPKVENIATRQAQIAWNRLSLTMSKETTGKDGVGGEAVNPSIQRAGSLRERLLELFPFSNVQPLYLRSPSVTVKATIQTQQYANENQADAPGRHR